MALGQAADSNAIFLKSKGKWDCPVESITDLDYYEKRKHICDAEPNNNDVGFFSDSCGSANAVFDGRVILVSEYDDVCMIVIKYGDYFIGYSNLSKSFVKKEDNIKAGEPIGTMGLGLDGKYELDMQLTTSRGDIDIIPWFKPCRCKLSQSQ